MTDPFGHTVLRDGCRLMRIKTTVVESKGQLHLQVQPKVNAASRLASLEQMGQLPWATWR